MRMGFAAIAVLSCVAGAVARASDDIVCIAEVFQADTRARLADAPLEPGETTMTALVPTESDTEWILGTNRGVLRWDLPSARATQRLSTPRPARGITYAPETALLGLSTVWGPAMLQEWVAPHRIMEVEVRMRVPGLHPDVIPSDGEETVPFSANYIEVSPEGHRALATFPPTVPLLAAEIDLDENKIRPLVMVSGGPRMVGTAGVAYVDRGTRGIVAATPSQQSAGGFVYDCVTREISHRFALPYMHPNAGSPLVESSPFGSQFAITTISGPPPGTAGERIVATQIFALGPRTPGSALEVAIEPVTTLSWKETLSAEITARPYLPPILFTDDVRMLVGTRDGQVELINLKRKRVGIPDDFAPGEKLTTFQDGHKGSRITALASSRAHGLYASGSHNGNVAIWSATGRRTSYRVHGFTGPVRELHFTTLRGKPSILVAVRRDQTRLNEIPPTSYFIWPIDDER